MTEPPTPEMLRKLLRYEPETGKMFWLPRPESMFPTPHSARTWNTKNANREAFTSSNKTYKGGYIFKTKYLAHRVAYALYYNSWPEETIDHINGDPCDNRIINLRCVSLSVNLRNQKKRSTNTSGHTGVSVHARSGGWQAFIAIGGKNKHLGVYPNIEDAIAARKAAEEGHGFTERHGT
jgi:hypothetical protein